MCQNADTTFFLPASLYRVSALKTEFVSSKAYIYATHEDRLLIFSHPEHPGVGFQIPGGSINVGETPIQAARREFFEETGLEASGDMEELGSYTYSMFPFRREVQKRFVFHLRLKTIRANSWIHSETHPEKVGQSPDKFHFIWAELNDHLSDALSVGQGMFLHKLMREFPQSHKSTALKRFDFEAIESRIRDFRSERWTTQIGVLKQLCPDVEKEARLQYTALGRAILHHAFYKAVLAAESADLELAHDALDLLSSHHDVDDPHAIVQSAFCDLPKYHDYESPPYLINPRALANSCSPKVKNVFTAAVRLISDLNMDQTVTGAFGLVVLLKEKQDLDPSDSYTLSGLPGTVYIDTVPSIFRMGEIVLHEASHNWLNDALASFGVQFPKDKQWWSPWRHRPRPTFGILQGCFVFSRLLQYFAKGLGCASLSLSDTAYARKRLAVEHAILQQHQEMFKEVIDLLPQSDLHDLCAEELNRALNLCPEG
jgi:8-oxo-dGTP pyrophosphatase MutT (NUDIX family)